MTRVLQTLALIPASKSEIFELLISEKFNHKKSDITDSKVIAFTKKLVDGSTQTTLSRKFNREVPALAQNFIGNEILADEIFIWNSTQDQAEITIKITKAPIEISGTLQLSEKNLETELAINLYINTQLPFFKEKIEDFAEKIWTSISNSEVNLLRSHFTQQF